MGRYSTEPIPTLAIALEERLRVDELKQLVALTDERKGTKKADLVAAILRHFEGDGLRHAWERLDTTQRSAVAEVVYSGSQRFDAKRFHAKYGCDPNWGSADRYGYSQTPSALCLFFYHGIMPEDIRQRLKAFVPVPANARVATLDAPPPAYERIQEEWRAGGQTSVDRVESFPVVVRETEHSAQRELMSVLRLVDAGKVRASDKTRRASAAGMTAIEGVLDGGPYYPDRAARGEWDAPPPGPIRAFAWPLLLQAGKLAKLVGTQLQLTPAGRRALNEPAAPTLRRLWNKWVDNRLVDELARVECIKGQTGKGKRGLTDPDYRRMVIHTMLGECPAERWIDMEELFRFREASGNNFAVSDNAWTLYIGHAEYGSLGYDGGSQLLAQSYLLAVLFEYAATLGLVDVAFLPPEIPSTNRHDLWGTDDLSYVSRYDGLLCIRINRLGAWILERTKTYEPTQIERKPVLRVLPNLEITVVAATIEPADELALDGYAVRTSPRVWQLQQEKLLAAMDEGHALDAIREFLEARSNEPLPNTAQRLLKDIADRQGCLRDCGTARLVECRDDALAALIANHTQTGKLCLPAGPRHLVVPTDSEAAFRRAVRKLGYLVAAGGKLTKGE